VCPVGLKSFIFYYSDWVHYINLAGSELPIINVDDFAEKLKSLNITNSIYSNPIDVQTKEERFTMSHIMEPDRPTLTRTGIKKSPPPFNLTIYKGSKNVILSRNFAEFVIKNPVAKIFREWTKDMSVPDEHFIPTLYRIQDTNPIKT
jgi:N-acetyllactosaminide beta-1,6-N-acetylglucosaminyltransferase